ncbi:hypothetical protein ASC96_28125 [Rhizobium sp. Root1204]|nr:hypothetical protein ASC96_28125 [Rhizobium sp. Root1204]
MNTLALSDKNFLIYLADQVELVPGNGWACLVDGSQIVLSQSMAAHLQLPPHQPMMPSSILRRLQPDNVAAFARKWLTSIASGEQFDAIHRTRFGSIGFRFSSKLLSRTDSPASFWIGTALEIDSALKPEQVGGYSSYAKGIGENAASQKALKDREEQLRLVVGTIPAVVWETETNGKTTFFNRRPGDFPDIVLPATGDPKEALFTAMRSVIHPDDQAQLQEAMERSYRTGDGWQARYRRRSDSGYRWLEGRTTPLLDDKGNLVRWYGIGIDVEDEVRAREQYRLAQEDLERVTQIASLAELSASIAHEISQPLASAAVGADACVRWLSAEPPNIQKAKLSAAGVHRDTELAAEIVSRVRAMFQLGEGHKQTCSINTIVSDVCSIFSHGEGARGVLVSKRLDAEEPLVVVDPLQIRQVLMNLLRNASEATAVNDDRARSIDVQTSTRGQQVLVSVEDRGPGISELTKIFEPFYTTKDSGMGVGLAISRSMISLHGGTIWAENTGEGARVTFSLQRMNTNS